MASEPPSTPAADRNLAPLTAVLAARLPASGTVLEVASGTGRHAAHWAERFTALTLQPSEPDADRRADIERWRRVTAVTNLRPALDVDVTAVAWWEHAAGPWAAIIAVNLLHIAPWAATVGLFAGAGRTLEAAGKLLIYGPFAEDGVLEPASNRQFDASLRMRDAAWGIRDVAALRTVAAADGLVLAEQVAMPANNRVLVFERRRCA